MKNRQREAVTPSASHDTIRREIMLELEKGLRTSKDLSAAARIPEREVYGHLEHIRKTIANVGRHLMIKPAECKNCGFKFSKRARFTKPGKCPVCKEQFIRGPLFSIDCVR